MKNLQDMFDTANQRRSFASHSIEVKKVIGKKSKLMWNNMSAQQRKKRNEQLAKTYIAKRISAGLTPTGICKTKKIRKELGLSLQPGKNRCKKISTPHGIFESVSACAKALNNCTETIRKRLNDKNLTDWKYI
jgi:hypothetical protein